MPKIKRLHFKDINALRFFAFIPIFIFFTSVLLKNEKSIYTIELNNLLKDFCVNSFDFFFLISSFLITSLALREYKYRKQFELKKFYIRKVLRLVPLLLIALFFLFYFHDKIVTSLNLSALAPQSFSYYFLGFPNYFSQTIDEKEAYTLAIWMVYMYFQFYLIWGLILKFFKPYLTYISFTVVVIGIVIRIIHSSNGSEYIYDTLSYGVPIGLGTLVASYNRNNSTLKDFFKTLSKLKIQFGYLFGISCLFILYPILNQTIFSALIPITTSTFFIFIILEQTFSKHSIFKLRKNKVVSKLGEMSYGLLVFTPIIGTLIIITFESIDRTTDSLFYTVIFLGITFILTWIISDISYNSYEKIFKSINRNLKKV